MARDAQSRQLLVRQPVTLAPPTETAGAPLEALERATPESPARELWRRFSRDRAAVVGATTLLLALLIALVGPLISPFSPTAQNSDLRLAPPGTESYLLGGDQLGRDIVSRLLYGARLSLLAALLPVGAAVAAGLVLGLTSGYYGGAVDMIVSRAVDIVLAFPAILLAIGIVSALGPGLQKEVDWIAAVPPDSVPGLVKSPDLVVKMESIPHTWMWRMNFKNEYFSNKKVRQAVALAVDRDRMAKGLLRGTAEPASQFWAPGSPGYRATPKEMTYTYDPVRAKALLTEAGYPNGINVRVFVPNSGSGMMVPIPMNESIQEDLAKVGIRVTFQIVEWQAYLSRSAAGMPPEYAAFGTSLGTEDFTVLHRQFHSALQPPNGGNPQWYGNPEVDRLLDEASRTLDEDRRTGIYQKVNDLITEDVVFLNVVHDKAPFAWHKSVKGFVHTKSWNFSFAKTWLDR